MNHELNARVEHEVFGHNVQTDDDGFPFRLMTDENGNEFMWPLPDYSGDIAAAWLVVEELAKQTCFIDVLSNMTGKWYCEFGSHSNSGVSTWGMAQEVDTAPLAICHAALDICANLREGA